MTSFSVFHSPIRAVLGDRQVHGLWMYDEASIDSALRAVFAFGRGPDNYALEAAASIDATVGITPEVTMGDPFAIVCCEAALLLITGEDGASMVRTRAMTIRDEGHRKRDLLRSLELQVYRIRGGDSVFVTLQSLAAFLGFKENGGLAFVHPWGIPPTVGCDGNGLGNCDL